MKKEAFLFVAVCLWAMSCTKEKTDYEAERNAEVPEHYEFKEAIAPSTQRYRVSIEALNGSFYTGYNEVRVKITDTRTQAKANATAVTFLPVAHDAEGSHSSCPHQYELNHRPDADYFEGYVVFTDKNGPQKNWELFLSFTINDQTHPLRQSIPVLAQPNKNLGMTSFTGKDGEEYFIALVSPQKPKVAENNLVAGIYKRNKPVNPPSGGPPDPSRFSYSVVDEYILELDPRMPEPSMGNHSSPNNEDLTQRDDGLYQGVVNYTMTGNWTLNFVMRNKNGEILKGTEVPTDFTPGVDGVKSELYIDILF